VGKLSRQAFIEAYGASCNNWRNSWSFVNHAEQFVIFGAWDQRLLEDGSGTVVFSKKWFTNSKGNKHGSYDRSREHIRLIEDKGYALRTFPMEYSDEDHDENGNGPAKIGSWSPVLSYATLRRVKDDWVALTHDVVPMPKGMYPESEDKRVTEKDIILAELIFPILLDAVKDKEVLTYGDVVKAVTKKYPDNAAAQSLVPVIVGRRLGVIWRFTQDQGCPHIGSLVINQHTNECGEGITSLLDPEAEREKVYAYPWEGIHVSFKSHLEKERANRKISKKKLKRKKKPDALEVFFEYLKEQESDEEGLPVVRSDLAKHRDRIIELVMEGHEPETAFGLVLADLAKKKRLPIKERDGFVEATLTVELSRYTVQFTAS